MIKNCTNCKYYKLNKGYLEDHGRGFAHSMARCTVENLFASTMHLSSCTEAKTQLWVAKNEEVSKAIKEYARKHSLLGKASTLLGITGYKLW